AKRCLDTAAYIRPIQPAQAASQGRNRDGLNPQLGDHATQVLKTALDVFQPALATPVPLRREVDDEPRRGEPPGLVHEHPTGLDLILLAGGRVGLKVLGPCLLELQRDAS